MERLTPRDVALLEASGGPVHGHVGQLLVLASADPSLDLDGLGAWYRSRLDLVPRFRQRLVQVPMQVHRPLWVDDPTFDLDHHVQRVSLDRGDLTGLEEAAGRLMGLPLDLRRPPWEAWLIEGLDDGRVAVLTKQHLAAIDDRRGDEMAVALFDTVPGMPLATASDWRPEPQPTDAERIGHGVASRLRRPRLLVDAARDRVRRRQAMPGRRVPGVFTEPLTTHREVATTTLALRAVKAVKDHHDVSVNDVVLAVCAGGLRRWLDARDALPIDPLLALVPVSLAGDTGDEADHHVSSVISSLATDTQDPALRIQVIQDATREARRRRAIGARRLRDWATFAAPAVLGQAGRVALGTVHDAPASPGNVVVANIPGPTVPLFVAGVQVQDLFFFGPIAQDLPLAVTVVSVGDRMDVALLGCPATAPGVDELADHVEAALHELVETVPAGARPDESAVALPALPDRSSGPEADLGRATTGGRLVDVSSSGVLDGARAAIECSRATRE